MSPAWLSRPIIVRTHLLRCLADGKTKQGGTIHFLGSNKCGTRDNIPPNTLELLVPFEADSGDILMIDGRGWYGSTITRDEDRVLLFNSYISPHIRSRSIGQQSCLRKYSTIYIIAGSEGDAWFKSGY